MHAMRGVACIIIVYNMHVAKQEQASINLYTSCISLHSGFSSFTRENSSLVDAHNSIYYSIIIQWTKTLYSLSLVLMYSCESTMYDYSIMSGEMLNYFFGLFSSLVSTCCMSSLMFFSKSSTLLPISSSRHMIWSDICSNFCCCERECGAREEEGEREKEGRGRRGKGKRGESEVGRGRSGRSGRVRGRRRRKRKSKSKH